MTAIRALNATELEQVEGGFLALAFAAGFILGHYLGSN